MSGICGWIGPLADDRSPEQLLERMVQGLPHYGECERRTRTTQNGGLCLNARKGEGHWYEDSQYCAAIEGYPRWADNRLAEAAIQSGHAYALVQAFREHGPGCLVYLRGAFAVAILNLTDESGFIAIDRTGTNAMCYAPKVNDCLVFGTTVDSVAAHHAVESTISPQSLFNFLFFVDRVPAPFAIYEEQAKLAPAQYLHVTPGGRKLEYYWRLPYSEDSQDSLSQLGEEMFAHLRSAVRNAAGDHPRRKYGAFLSGGLDSSTVSGLMSELEPEPANTFTIGFENEGFDESGYARIVSKKFHTKHTEYYISGEDVLDVIPKIAKIYDEPFSNHSAIPTHFCAKLARDSGVDLLLAGDGGDELFAGNTRYIAVQQFDQYGRIPSILRKGLIEPFMSLLPAPRGGIVSKINNRIRVSNLSVAARLYWSNLYDRVPMGTIFDPDLFAEIDPLSPVRLVDEIYDAALGDGQVKRMMHVDLRITIADGDLRKVNRMCEMAGVRVRYPFLDDDVVEFSGRVPERFMVKDNHLRYFYKEAAKDFLPREVIEKKKHGFGLPIADLSDQHKPLLDYACDCVTDLKRRHYFQPAFLDKLIEQHRGIDHGFFRLDIFEFVFFELWLRLHVDGRGR